MLLVLGRPGSGCTTFLKSIGNQRAGYESIDGDVTYGGEDAKTVAEKYRSEGSYPSTSNHLLGYNLTGLCSPLQS
jgi:ATP-binding cassette subfamily G (WHITE) protein 2 (SNQ2)